MTTKWRLELVVGFVVLVGKVMVFTMLSEVFLNVGHGRRVQLSDMSHSCLDVPAPAVRVVME